MLDSVAHGNSSHPLMRHRVKLKLQIENLSMETSISKKQKEKKNSHIVEKKFLARGVFFFSGNSTQLSSNFFTFTGHMTYNSELTLTQNHDMAHYVCAAEVTEMFLSIIRDTIKQCSIRLETAEKCSCMPKPVSRNDGEAFPQAVASSQNNGKLSNRGI